MKVTLIVPTLNEISGMRAIMPRVKREWVDQVIVVDGGSTDGTLEYSREQGYEVVMQSGRGLMNACSEGFLHARGEIIITFSPDGNSIPELIPLLADRIRQGDEMTIASRYMEGVRNEDDTWLTYLGNRFFTGLLNFMFRVHYTDTLVIYRAYTRGAVERMGLIRSSRVLPFERYCPHLCSWETYASVRAAKLRLRVGSIPGAEPARIGGASKTRYVSSALFLLVLFAREFLLRAVEAVTAESLQSSANSSRAAVAPARKDAPFRR